MSNKKQRILQAVKDGLITNKETLSNFVLLEEMRDILAYERGEQGEKGEAGKDGRNGIDGKDGRDGINGRNGIDAVVDIDQIITRATERATQAIKDLMPDIRDIEKELPQLGHEIRDALELLAGEERLDASAIKGLPEYQNEIKKLGKRVDGLGGSQARNFYQLYDVPQAYAGQSGKVVSVKSTEDGLEFTTASSGSVSDAVYGAGWDGDTTTAPSKNVVYDKIETLAGGHDAITLSGGASTLLVLSTQDLDVNTQTANKVYASATSGGAAKPNFRALVAADIPSLSSVYQPLDAELTGLASLSYASGTPFVRMEASGAFTLDTTAYVPYTGATTNVDLGAYTLTTTAVYIAQNSTINFDNGGATETSVYQAGNGIVGVSGSGGIGALLDASSLATSDKIIHIQNTTGTMALTSDLTNIKLGAIEFNMGDGTNAITANSLGGVLNVPYAGTITGWELLSCDASDLSGSITIDVQKKDSISDTTWASICGAGTKPNLDSAVYNSGSDLTNWTTAVATGEYYKIVASAITTVKKIAVVLKVSKT